MENPRLLETLAFNAKDITSKVRSILPMIALALAASAGCKDSPEAVAQQTLDECAEIMSQLGDSLEGLPGYCKDPLTQAGILRDPSAPLVKPEPTGNCDALIKELDAKGIECEAPYTSKEDGTTITCRDMGDPGTDKYSTGYQINCTQ